MELRIKLTLSVNTVLSPNYRLLAPGTKIPQVDFVGDFSLNPLQQNGGNAYYSFRSSGGRKPGKIPKHLRGKSLRNGLV